MVDSLDAGYLAYCVITTWFPESSFCPGSAGGPMSEKGLSIANIALQLKLGIDTLMVVCWGIGTRPKHEDHWAGKLKLLIHRTTTCLLTGGLEDR
jgi:hypothetical protein